MQIVKTDFQTEFYVPNQIGCFKVKEVAVPWLPVTDTIQKLSISKIKFQNKSTYSLYAL